MSGSDLNSLFYILEEEKRSNSVKTKNQKGKNNTIPDRQTSQQELGNELCAVENLGRE